MLPYDTTLKQRMDKHVPANPTFADAYRTARVIIDRSGPQEEEEPTTPTA